MSRFLSPRHASLEAYTPGEQPRDMQYVKLNTNESPYPPSPSVIKAVSSAEVSLLNLYSDPTCAALKERLAAAYGVGQENVFVSNGSDDILNFAFMAFCDGERGMAFPDITYGFYPVFGQLHHVPCKIIPLEDDFTVDTSKYEGIGMNVVLANPNAPTGMSVTVSQIERIAATNPDNVVIIDEAYVDFGGTSALPLIGKYKNLLVVRTYSKSRSLAGARLGFAFGDSELIADLEKIKYSTNPYDINRLTQVAGRAALDDENYYKANAEKIIETRAYTVAELEKRGFSVLASDANFVFAALPGTDGGELYQKLKSRGVLVRHFNSPRIKDRLRITIGTKEQMKALFKALD